MIVWSASGNPFNGAAFAILTVILVAAAVRAANQPVRLASPFFAVSGGLLIVFGSIYPHFLVTNSWTAYFYAAPFGLLPCPTLSVVTGVALTFRLYRARSWSAAVIAAGLLYGVIGVIRLGVSLDYGLLVGALALTGAVVHDAATRRWVGADPDERTRLLPAGELIP